MGELLSVPAITVICYLVTAAIKLTKLNNRFLPVISGVTGGLLGILGLYIIPQFPANNLISAFAVGIASGLAATGANQIIKQLLKPDSNKE